MADEGRAAGDIRVKAFRQLFIWPLALDLAVDEGRGRSRAERPDPAAAAFRMNCAFAASPDWSEVEDLLDHALSRERWPAKSGAAGGPAAGGGADAASCAKPDAWAGEDAARYAEFVYFYDFLRNMLFKRNELFDGRDTSDAADIRLWRRTDVRKLRFTIPDTDGGPSSVRLFDADVHRLNVYVIRTGMAIMALEVDFGQHSSCVAKGAEEGAAETKTELSLADVLNVTDYLRRSHAPFFNGNAAAKVPEAVWWLGEGDRPCVWPEKPAGSSGAFCPPKFSKEWAFVSDRSRPTRTTPVFEHWRALLAPLQFAGYARDSDGPVWRHVLDERIPVMSFVSLTGAADRLDRGSLPNDNRAGALRADLRLVSRGDWIRLCFADEAGSDQLPYNGKFLERFEDDYCYDRFFPDERTGSAARIMFAGYHVAFVGAGWFFDIHLVNHFRRHYFQMVLLANMEFASLLATSSRISAAVGALTRDQANKLPEAQVHFRREIEAVQENFLRLVHRYRFTNVSNQVQATELFGKLRTSMRIDPLYQDVKAELEAAAAFNTSVEQGQIARSSMGLTVVATIGAAVGVAFALLSVGLVGDPLAALMAIKPAQEGGTPGRGALWLDLSAGVGTVALVLGVFLLATRSLQTRVRDVLAPRQKPGDDPLRPLFDRILVDGPIVAIVLGAFLLAIRFVSGRPF